MFVARKPFIQTKRVTKAKLQPLITRLKQDNVQLFEIVSQLEEITALFWNSPHEWPIFTRDPQPTQAQRDDMVGPFGASLKRWLGIENKFAAFLENKENSPSRSIIEELIKLLEDETETRLDRVRFLVQFHARERGEVVSGNCDAEDG